jgi:hypothetical protein
MSGFVTPDALTALRDRERGTELLAEALSQHQFAGRYRELLRVFELGFGASESKLVFMLAEFLARRPRLGYTKTEVKGWVQGRRGRAMHADRSVPLIGADLGDGVDRMLLAAYEVLFNKENWNAYDSVRRDVWTPSIGLLDAEGNWFVRHRTPLGQAKPLRLGECLTLEHLERPFKGRQMRASDAGRMLGEWGSWKSSRRSRPANPSRSSGRRATMPRWTTDTPTGGRRAGSLRARP